MVFPSDQQYEDNIYCGQADDFSVKYGKKKKMICSAEKVKNKSHSIWLRQNSITLLPFKVILLHTVHLLSMSTVLRPMVYEDYVMYIWLTAEADYLKVDIYWYFNSYISTNMICSGIVIN